MNARRDDDAGAMEKLGARVRQRAMTGAEASTVGFILVAYIGVFAGLGYWLDTLFKTSWIVAVGVLGGAAIGFREMFRIAQKLTRESIATDESAERAKLSQARETDAETSIKTAPAASTPETQESPGRSRIFSVPPPPSASFDKAQASRKVEVASSEATSGEATSTPPTDDDDLSEEELVKRLLGEELLQEEKPDDADEKDR